MSRHLWFPLMLVAASLVMAGCSYTPARIQSEPLIVIDDDRGGPPARREGFCPPGQAKKGRC
ncbi:hypothetical protein [Halomonas sp. BM-2019]|uniref:hypothetical protein n=1 Tax=Halomonas sp. BM-2019 TaxID=2811227 RepID=UPI001B3C2388|nr:MAG: hypothetical protein J5F18_10620 [Halomonas sp. BM-2019]